MKRSRKSNRVSWAPGVNLCQVKLFLREDCPAKVGGEHQDTLRAKTSWTLHPTGTCANDLPPGFEGGNCTSGLKCDLAKIPMIQWKIPPEFALNSDWHVAAGEESKEVEAQKSRENRVLEAVYPRVSDIPPNPISLDVKVERYDDSRIPLVPLTPIEDDEGAEVYSAQPKTPTNFETLALPMPPGLSNFGTQSSDMMATAFSALTAVMKTKEQGSLVDTELLVKILSDPKMVEKLIHNRGYPSAAGNGNAASAPATISSPMPLVRNSNHLVKDFRPSLSTPASLVNIVSVSMPTRALPVSASMPMRVESSVPLPASVSMPMRVESSVPLPISVSMPMRVESSVPLPGTNIHMISGHRSANGNAYATMNQVQPALSMMPVQPNSVHKVQPVISSTTMHTMEANTVKDVNYFKNLIREHGREKEEGKGHNMTQIGSHLNHIQNLKVVQNLKPVALKNKFRKPCMFFNTSKGCRQGSDCPYLHEIKSLQWQTGRTFEAPSAKRMKLSGEITGRI